MTVLEEAELIISDLGGVKAATPCAPPQAARLARLRGSGQGWSLLAALFVSSWAVYICFSVGCSAACCVDYICMGFAVVLVVCLFLIFFSLCLCGGRAPLKLHLGYTSCVALLFAARLSSQEQGGFCMSAFPKQSAPLHIDSFNLAVRDALCSKCQPAGAGGLAWGMMSRSIKYGNSSICTSSASLTPHACRERRIRALLKLGGDDACCWIR